MATSGRVRIGPAAFAPVPRVRARPSGTTPCWYGGLLEVLTGAAPAAEVEVAGERRPALAVVGQRRAPVAHRGLPQRARAGAERQRGPADTGHPRRGHRPLGLGPRRLRVAARSGPGRVVAAVAGRVVEADALGRGVLEELGGLGDQGRVDVAGQPVHGLAEGRGDDVRGVGVDDVRQRGVDVLVGAGVRAEVADGRARGHAVDGLDVERLLPGPVAGGLADAVGGVCPLVRRDGLLVLVAGERCVAVALREAVRRRRASSGSRRRRRPRR